MFLVTGDESDLLNLSEAGGRVDTDRDVLFSSRGWWQVDEVLIERMPPSSEVIVDPEQCLRLCATISYLFWRVQAGVGRE